MKGEMCVKPTRWNVTLWVWVDTGAMGFSDQALRRPVETVSLTWLAVNSRSWQMPFAILNSWEG